ncbi:MAG: VOC family protein [Micromonosporaceae bacterium]
MSKPTSYADGAPAWVELSVPDLDAAKEFYGQLLGWDFVADNRPDRRYEYALQGGLKVAGIQQKPEGSPLPTVWIVYLASSDLEVTLKEAVERGAKVLAEPMCIPHRGRLAVFRDPTGAAVALWEANGHLGAEVINEIGTTCWHEVLTHDIDAADEFYSALFGYELHRVDDETTILKLAGQKVAGRRIIGQKLQGKMPPHWQTYVWVADVEATVAKLVELGGSVRFGPVTTPHGPLAGVADPFGAHFTVMWSTER